ncbi:hypothetical protein C5688_01570 [Methylocystis sp. MitZ-2018]|nr:hypothetical protein C5688_01570 [Methylocystis sp. MitZ-2018]
MILQKRGTNPVDPSLYLPLAGRSVAAGDRVGDALHPARLALRKPPSPSRGGMRLFRQQAA